MRRKRSRCVTETQSNRRRARFAFPSRITSARPAGFAGRCDALGSAACAPISVPGFVILKTLVSAGFAVSAVKRDLVRSVIRFVVAQPF
jgi:hypothetical protein